MCAPELVSHSTTLIDSSCVPVAVRDGLVLLDDDRYDSCKEALDRARSQAMARAELKCRKLCMGQIDFSPELIVWAKRKEVWELVCRYRRGNKVSTTTIRRRARAAGEEHPLTATLEEAQARLTECEDQHVGLKPQSQELRRKFLLTTKDKAESSGELKRANFFAFGCLFRRRRRR